MLKIIAETKKKVQESVYSISKFIILLSNCTKVNVVLVDIDTQLSNREI